MNATNVSVLILATMVSVLAGMVGYMYWQQNRVLQSVNALSLFISSQFVPQPIEVEEDSEDDRQSVDQEVEVVDTTAPAPAPAPAPEPVDLKDKSSAELRELLSQKGLPYGKRDSKATLLELLKAAN